MLAGSPPVVSPIEVAEHVLETAAELLVVFPVERRFREIDPLIGMRGQRLRQCPAVPEARPRKLLDRLDLAGTQATFFDAVDLLHVDMKVTDLGERQRTPLDSGRSRCGTFAKRVEERGPTARDPACAQRP